MKLKLKKIPMKPFVKISSIIYVIAGFLLGLVVTIVSFIVPDEQGLAGVGPWSVVVFPFLNGVLGLLSSMFLAGMYNVLSPYIGAIEFEFEKEE